VYLQAAESRDMHKSAVDWIRVQKPSYFLKAVGRGQALRPLEIREQRVAERTFERFFHDKRTGLPAGAKEF